MDWADGARGMLNAEPSRWCRAPEAMNGAFGGELPGNAPGAGGSDGDEELVGDEFVAGVLDGAAW